MARRKLLPLGILIALLFGAGLMWLLSAADTAWSEQYTFNESCWPDVGFLRHELDFERRQIHSLWEDYIEDQLVPPSWFEAFFLRRVNHRLLGYMTGLAALLGWCVSVFLNAFVRTEDGPMRDWTSYTATLVLSLAAGVVVWLLVIIGASIHPQNCIHKSVHYSALLSAGLAGLFPSLFYDWLKSKAAGVWDNLVRKE